jgi:hypothetical protein
MLAVVCNRVLTKVAGKKGAGKGSDAGLVWGH